MPSIQAVRLSGRRTGEETGRPHRIALGRSTTRSQCRCDGVGRGGRESESGEGAGRPGKAVFGLCVCWSMGPDPSSAAGISGFARPARERPHANDDLNVTERVARGARAV